MDEPVLDWWWKSTGVFTEVEEIFNPIRNLSTEGTASMLCQYKRRCTLGGSG